jgi:hypothetical protein
MPKMWETKGRGETFKYRTSVAVGPGHHTDTRVAQALMDTQIHPIPIFIILGQGAQFHLRSVLSKRCRSPADELMITLNIFAGEIVHHWLWEKRQGPS